MYIYKLTEGHYGSYEDGPQTYFKELDCAILRSKSMGFCRGRTDEEGWVIMEHPFHRKRMLICGNFLLDVTKAWLRSDRYHDDDIWSPSCDFVMIQRIKVLRKKKRKKGA